MVATSPCTNEVSTISNLTALRGCFLWISSFYTDAVLYTVTMEIEKIHKGFSSTVLECQKQVDTWRKSYYKANCRNASICNQLKIMREKYDRQLEITDSLRARNMVLLKRIVELQTRLDDRRVDQLLSNPEFIDNLRNT